MADKKLYGVFFGPYLYEDDAALDDPDGDFSGMTWDASVTDGLHLCAGVRFLDSDQSHHLTLTWNENDSGNRTLQFLVAGGNRSLTLNENFTVADGYDVTLQALGQANQLTLNEGLTIGDGHSGTLTFSAASKVITVEDTTIANNPAYVDGPLSPQVLSGCTISVGTNAGTAKVAAGTVLLRTTASDSGVLRKYSVSETDNITLASADTSYFVQIQWNSGSPIAAVSASSANGQTDINIGKVLKESDDTFHYTNGGYRLFDGVAKLHHRAGHLREWEMCSEVNISDNGDKTFVISSGHFFRGINKTSFSTWDSSGADRFTYALYYDGAWHYIADQQYIDVDNYNDVTDAVDGLKTCNRYKCDWVFVHPDDGDVFVVYGQDDDNVGNIEDSTVPSLPDLVDTFGALIGRIIIDGGTTAFHRIEMINQTPLIPSPVIDHNDLSSIQGGTTSEYYHLTSAQHTVATQAATDALDGYMTSTYAGKLDGIESGADVTDFANVQAALAAASGAVDFNSQNLTSVGTISSAGLLALDGASGTQVNRNTISFIDLKTPSGGSSTNRFRISWNGAEARYENIDGSTITHYFEGKILGPITYSGGAVNFERNSFVYFDLKVPASGTSTDRLRIRWDGALARYENIDTADGITHFFDGKMGVNIGTPSAQLHVDQSSTTAAIPVLMLDQADVSEQCIKFTSDSADRDINLFTVDVTGTPTLKWDESLRSCLIMLIISWR